MRATGGGRKPTPTKLKLLRGNPGHRPLNETARKEWSRAGNFLLQLGLISDLDLAAFAAYCVAYGRWVEAEQSLQTHGVLMKSPSGFPMQSPYLSIANRAMEQMRSLLSEFGMSPASRSRVSGIPVVEEESEFDRLYR